MKDVIQGLNEIKAALWRLEPEDLKGRLYRLSTAKGADPRFSEVLQYLLNDMKNLQFASKAEHPGGAVAYTGILAMLDELIKHAEILERSVHIEQEPVTP